MKVIVVSLIGKENVGKSTLFNKLTKTNDALITRFSGTTRDKRYGTTTWKGRKFLFIDTGAILVPNERGLEKQISYQSFSAIEESDIVLYILDRNRILKRDDWKFLRTLQKKKKILS